MKFKWSLLCLGLIFACSSSDDNHGDIESSTFYRVMDLSFQSELEDYNINYKDGVGNSVDLLDFVTEKGTNLVRLKLWHTPQNGENGLNDVKAYAQRITSKNADFLLNFHYSDFWADPGTQTPPLAWQNLTQEQLQVVIYDYTKSVIEVLRDQNTLPKIVQIGNETDSGFLWDYGRVWDEFSNNWPNYSTLVKEAIRAVRDVDDTIRIMIHISNLSNAKFFFEALEPHNVDFDIIGLSYYPQFHTQNLNEVTSKLNELALVFDKDILMVEVAYPFTFEWNDNLGNFIGDTSQTLNEFAPTPEGQKAYLEWLEMTLKNIPN
ncbi:MAG: glycosyl hydrolase 53 family protein, partial [Bacteroidota bacterium]